MTEITTGPRTAPPSRWRESRTVADTSQLPPRQAGHLDSGQLRDHRADPGLRIGGVRVFVDFWNYTLSMRGVDEDFRTDWSSLGPVLSRAATELVTAAGTGEYQGLNFYGSYDPNREKDRKLLRWATTKVSSFPGVSVSIVPRQRKRSPPRCPACYDEVATCPACGADMRGTEEKGVDLRMATDMIRLAWSDNYDIAVLV